MDDRAELAFGRARTLASLRRALGLIGRPDDPKRLFDAINATINQHVRGDLRRARRLADALVRWVEAENLADVLPLAWRAAGRSRIASGRPRQAIEFYTRARKLHRRRRELTECAKIDRVLVDCFMYLGEYRKSLLAGQRALRHFQSIGAPLDVGMTLVNLGNVHHRRDDNKRALEHYERASQFMSQNADPVMTARVDFNRANTLANLARETEAIELYESCARVYTDNGLELAAVQCRYSAAYARFLIGEYSQAVEGLRLAREGYAKLGDIAGVALCDLDLAEVAFDLNLVEDGIAAAQRAKTAFGKLNRHYEHTKARLFELLLRFREGEFSQAAAVRLEAAFKREKNSLYSNVVELLRAEREAADGRFVSAERRAQKAAAQFESLGSDDRASNAKLIAARSALAAGDYGKARKLTEELATSRVEQRPRVAYRFNHWRGRLSWTQGNTKEAVRFFSRARIAAESLSETVSPDDDKPYFWEDKRAIYLDLADMLLRNEDADSWSAAAENLDDARVRTLIEQLNISPHNYHQTAAEHRVRESERASGKKGKSAVHQSVRTPKRMLTESPGSLVKAIRQSLPRDAVIVQYYLGARDSKAILIAHDSVQHVDLPASRLDIERAVNRYRLETDRVTFESMSDSARALDVLRRLSDMVWMPLTEHLKDSRSWILPDGSLWGVPFHALAQTLHQEAPLPQIATSLRHLQMRIEPVANSLIDDSSTSLPLFVAPHPKQLPGTKQESRVFQNTLGQVQRLIGTDATIDSVLSLASTAPLVHFATHAHFRWDNPGFSGLELSDGLLTLARIGEHYRHHGSWLAEMIVLSGCGTGLSRTVGGEEFVGLGRGFLAGGARRLLVALWDVDDQTTASWMRYFYECYAESRDWNDAWDSAVRKAYRRWRHPYHWAPFALVN